MKKPATSILTEAFRNTEDSSDGDRKRAFVAMPFRQELDRRYQQVIKPALEEMGFEVQRADELFGTEPVLARIARLIRLSDLVVADLTGRNPNVLYELGLANAFGKNALLLSESLEDIPVDLRHLTYVPMTAGVEESRRRLLAGAEAMLEIGSFFPTTPEQRLLLNSQHLGIVDLLPGDDHLAVDFMLSASSSLDILVLNGRALSAAEVQKRSEDLKAHFSTLDVRALVSSPATPHCQHYAEFDGSGETAMFRGWIETSLTRFRSLGLEPRFYSNFVTWAGIIADRRRAIAFTHYPAVWQSYFLCLEDKRGGPLYALKKHFDHLWEGSSKNP